MSEKTKGFLGDLETAKLYYYILENQRRTAFGLSKKEYATLKHLQKDIKNAEKILRERKLE